MIFECNTENGLNSLEMLLRNNHDVYNCWGFHENTCTCKLNIILLSGWFLYDYKFKSF